MKKKKGICHIPNCNKKAIRGFKSKHGTIQSEKYCTFHAVEVRKNGAFPECEVILLPEPLPYVAQRSHKK